MNVSPGTVQSFFGGWNVYVDISVPSSQPSSIPSGQPTGQPTGEPSKAVPEHRLGLGDLGWGSWCKFVCQ